MNDNYTDKDILNDEFIKEYEEQSNDGDEFENNINEKIDNYKQQNEQKDYNRPLSNYTKRPESSNKQQLQYHKYNQQIDHHQQHKLDVIREDSRIFTNNQHVSSPVLDKFSKYVQFHLINIENFWQSTKIKCNLDEFKSFLQKIAFNITQNDFQDLVSDLANHDGSIDIKSLCMKIEPWNNNADFMIEFIKEKSLRVAQESKKQFKIRSNSSKQGQGGSKTYIKSQNGNNFTSRPISGISKHSNLTKFSDMFNEALPLQNANLTQNLNNNKQATSKNISKIYLQKHKEKENEQERLLQLTIKRGKNEFEYDCLIKMGEANEISQQQGSKITYRAFKSSDGSLKVHVYELDKYIKDMTLEEFQREYNIIIKNSLLKKNKAWMTNDTKPDKLGEESGQVEKNARQQQLKTVLLETMMLTNVLKEQLAVLNKKGINNFYNQNDNSPKVGNTKLTNNNISEYF